MPKTEKAPKLVNMHLFPRRELELFMDAIQEILFLDAKTGQDICDNWLILKDVIEAKNDLEFERNKIYLMNMQKISEDFKGE